VLKGTKAQERSRPAAAGQLGLTGTKLWRNAKLEERMKLIALNDDQRTPSKKNRTVEARANDKTGT
jgi:hypothetical protein